MTNEKKLDIAVDLLLSEDMDRFLLKCQEYELAEEEYLTCPYCGSQIEHDLVNSQLMQCDSWEISYQYECNDCGKSFFECFERVKITKC